MRLSYLTKYEKSLTIILFLPKHADIILALWVGFSHAFKAFAHCPRLITTSAEAECEETMELDA